MHEPFYLRPPDFHYCLRSNPTYGWATGVAEDGSQILCCKRNWLVFDHDGNLMRSGEQEVPFTDGPIEVKRFWIPDCWLGVEDLPDVLAEYYTAPADFVMEPGDVESWLRDGQFVFYPGWTEYIMGPRGRVVSS